MRQSYTIRIFLIEMNKFKKKEIAIILDLNVNVLRRHRCECLFIYLFHNTLYNTRLTYRIEY